MYVEVTLLLTVVQNMYNTNASAEFTLDGIIGWLPLQFKATNISEY